MEKHSFALLHSTHKFPLRAACQNITPFAAWPSSVHHLPPPGAATPKNKTSSINYPIVVKFIIVVVVFVVIIPIAVAPVVFATATAAVVAAAVAVAIATTTNARICCSCHWLVVALLSAIRYHHRTPSCGRQCSCCRPLLPPIVVHRRHRRCCHCCRAATASTATTVVKLAVIHCQRKRQQQQHHQHTNGSTNVKMFTNPDDWTYLTYLQYQGNLAITKLLANSLRAMGAHECQLSN
jgi:hypothetical protein